MEPNRPDARYLSIKLLPAVFLLSNVLFAKDMQHRDAPLSSYANKSKSSQDLVSKSNILLLMWSCRDTTSVMTWIYTSARSQMAFSLYSRYNAQFAVTLIYRCIPIKRTTARLLEYLKPNLT